MAGTAHFGAPATLDVSIPVYVDRDPFLTPDELTDPYNLEMTCTITRNGAARFQGSTSTSRLHRKFEVLTEYLLRANHVPAGSVLLTGTGIIVTEDAALAPGDTVSICVPQIGELSNVAEMVS